MSATQSTARGASYSLMSTCQRCGSQHLNLTCAQHRGELAMFASRDADRRWVSETAERLSALVDQEQLYPLLTLCKVGHGAGQLTKAVGKLAANVVVGVLRTSVNDAPLKVPDGLGDRGQVPGGVQPGISGLLIGQLCETLQQVGSDWHVAGDRRGGGSAKAIGRRRKGAHYRLLTLHGLDTRHVTGAIVAASRWLQRRAWVRQVAEIPRPSGTTNTAGER